MKYKGVIIEESLEKKDVLEKVKIINTRVEKVVERHQTPWVEQWTLHDVEIEEDKAEEIAEEISKSLDSEHAWYADYKNDNTHYIIFRNKIFKINRYKEEEYAEASKYGVSLGIPPYQVSFKSFIKKDK